MKPKFRAWDTDNNCFFKPTYEAYKGNLEELVLDMSGDINIRTTSHTLAHESTFPNRFILNQYTGLKDRNGKEIYESDIIRNVNGQRKYIVTWDEKEAYFYGEMIGVKDSNFIDWKNFEIIGNIYETPSEVTP